MFFSIHDEGSQFDSGVFSEEGQNFLLNKRSNDPQTPVEISSTSVLDSLDNLDKKLSEFSNKRKPSYQIKGGSDKNMVTPEDLEFKQLLIRKLTLFKNNRVTK